MFFADGPVRWRQHARRHARLPAAHGKAFVGAEVRAVDRQRQRLAALARHADVRPGAVVVRRAHLDRIAEDDPARRRRRARGERKFTFARL